MFPKNKHHSQVGCVLEPLSMVTPKWTLSKGNLNVSRLFGIM